MHALARSLRPLAYFQHEPENPVKRPRLTAVQNSDEAAGTDPGIFVGGGGGGGSNYPNIFDKKKNRREREREREKTEGFVCSFPLSLLQKYGLNRHPSLFSVGNVFFLYN